MLAAPTFGALGQRQDPYGLGIIAFDVAVSQLFIYLTKPLRIPSQPMNPDTADISIQPQKGAWILALVPCLIVAFAVEMLRLAVNPFWWVPLLALISLLLLAWPFKSPVAIVFLAKTRTMEIRYRIGKYSQVFSFDDLDFIQSHIRDYGDAVRVQLEVCLKNGKRIPLISEDAAWDSSAYLFGFSGAREPQSLTDLRMNISSATGIRNLGCR